MDYVRLSGERGHANFGWLDSRHTFSFGNYCDPRHMGISVLRVINDDRVSGGAGFDTHPHRDMEIVSYVLEGSIEHRDSMGNQFTIPEGEVQRMSAGTGLTHSEYNASSTKPLRFLQIWIRPDKRGYAPGYEQASIPQRGALTALVTPDGRDGSISIHQDASIYRLRLSAGESFTLHLQERAGFLQVIRGRALVNGNPLGEGDGLGSRSGWESVVVGQSEVFEALWFDLPPEQGGR